MKTNNYKTKIEQLQQIGTRHMEANVPCEDVTYIREHKSFCFYGLADGQSNKTHCIEGAKRCLDIAADFLETNGIENIYSYKYVDELQYKLIKEIRNCIKNLAVKYHTSEDEFASTLVIIAFNPDTGHYVTTHIGDGCIIGINNEKGVQIISSPENGVTPCYTWLTTSSNALYHLRFQFGNIYKYRRICLVTDGAHCICKGKNISLQATRLLSEASLPEIESYWSKFHPHDDASCIICELSAL